VKNLASSHELRTLSNMLSIIFTTKAPFANNHFGDWLENVEFYNQIVIIIRLTTNVFRK
jgi:predicted membrane protein